MEEIVAKLLVPNSKTVQQGTKELKEAFKKPEAVPALCDVLVSSKNVEIRQSAAVLLRRRLGKKHQWNKVSVDIRNRIKQGMLQALVNEREISVKNAIAQFIGIIGKHEFPNNTWPEILQFIYTVCNSDNETDKELGMYTLSIMTEISKDSYIVHAESFAELFTKIISSLTNLTSNLSYYTVLTMTHLVPVIGGHQQMINVYHRLYPKVIEIINAFSSKDDRKACELFEIIEELIEYAVAVVVPHISLTVEMCLQIGANKAIPTSVQIKAIAVLGWLIRSKAKLIQKHKMIEPIIDVMIQVMAQKPEDESEANEDYYQGDPDEYTATTIASQTLDLIALHVPPDKVIPFILTRIEPAIQGNDIYAQKAAYLALAVLAEGCSEYIRKKYLEPFLKCVCNGITNENVVVRNAALFALGQFAEHLQPEISKYASELLPVLFQYLSQIYAHMENDKTEPPSLNRMFYALETFCENLDDGLLPYLPTLMERMLTALNPNHWSMQLKKTAFETVSAAASAAKEGMLPYFPKLLEIINVYLSVDADNDNYHLRSEALECLATLAQSIGNENFKPLAAETMKLGMQILEKSDDPDTRRSVYMLFASLASVMKEELSPILPQVVEQMINTIQSSEGIETHYADDEKDGADIYDDLSDSEDDLEEDIEIGSDTDTDSTQCKYSVENAYIDEKEQACITLRELCRNVGTPFLPYLEKSFEEIFKLINFPQNEIRKSSIEALQQFCIGLHETNTHEGRQACFKALQMLIPKCAEIIRTDEERNVVMCALDTYAELLDKIKGDTLVGDGHREAIMNCVIDVLTLKTACQDGDLEGGGEDEDEGEAEQDELLLEYAGDVIPKFGNAIQPDDFQCYFPNILQLIGSRTKKQYSESQRSFSYGTLAECMKPLGIYIEKFISQLLPLWFAGAKDKSDEVRNNSIYGLGEMALHGKDCVFPYPYL
ncbi:importin-4 isoform X2 [Agrilus planipennis]|uniref:Importin-4 isoform X2 n=1 Tax=Agrilus planipennis TaxID=224129 RepID=A0A1W4W8W9_AGRPL|nr:importin-4 isoform X2 [Agrilus planipennis]